MSSVTNAYYLTEDKNYSCLALSVATGNYVFDREKIGIFAGQDLALNRDNHLYFNNFHKYVSAEQQQLRLCPLNNLAIDR